MGVGQVEEVGEEEGGDLGCRGFCGSSDGLTAAHHHY